MRARDSIRFDSIRFDSGVVVVVVVVVVVRTYVPRRTKMTAIVGGEDAAIGRAANATTMANATDGERRGQQRRRFDVGEKVWARASFDDDDDEDDGGRRRRRRRKATIVDVREEKGDGTTTTTVWYYVHYDELNKRLDEWTRDADVDARGVEDCEDVVGGKGEGGRIGGGRWRGDGVDGGGVDGGGVVTATMTTTTTRNSKRRYNEIHNVDAGAEDLPPIDQALERAHEEKTKVKNVHSIELGRHDMDTWYYSPYPGEFGKCSKLFVCQYCFKYMRKAKTCVRHKEECGMKHPPGKRVYRHEQGEGAPVLSFWEIDGKNFKMYCQNLCLMAKLFLDHKTLYFDVEPFMFYVLTESTDNDETHDIVGYFSKEKVSVDNYNLSCILTLPAYQRKGYGSFLISMSYELSRREGVLGTPERPLSDLGQVSYRSYWSRVVLETLQQRRANMSVKDLSAELMFREADIVSALQSLNMIKYWKGQHIISSSPKIVEEHLRSFQKQSAVAGSQLRFDPDLLNWAPAAKPAK